MKKYWKIFLGLLLIIVAVLVYMNSYRPAQAEYEAQREQLNSSVSALQIKAAENRRYTKVQEQIPDSITEITEKRAELYSKFPVEMKEEDQIMYILYLEETFGTEIQFSFSTPQDSVYLSDGSALQTLTLTVNYECSYDEFQEMITYLATDDKITSVYDARLNYDAEEDVASGTITIMRYLMNSELLEYQKPDVTTPETGKENIFDEP
ncbi:MAG: hypothetical protein IKL27_05180 [Oscillospiraceae bacterium]|nr:hypothetical protein [Oscillospiraceae bacterium]